MKAYAVILRTDDEPEAVADKMVDAGYEPIQIDLIDETPDANPFKPSEIVWQA